MDARLRDALKCRVRAKSSKSALKYRESSSEPLRGVVTSEYMLKLLENRGILATIFMMLGYCAIPFYFGNWQGGLIFLGVGVVLGGILDFGARRRQLEPGSPLDLLGGFDIHSIGLLFLIVIPFYLLEVAVRKILYPDMVFPKRPVGVQR